MDPEFSFEGRASRGEYALAMAILVVLFWPVFLFVTLALSVIPPLVIAALVGIPTLFFVLALMTTVRRLQDIGISGAHALSPVVLVGSSLAFQHEPTTLICSSLLVVWGLGVLLGPSEEGPNRYGPQPVVKG